MSTQTIKKIEEELSEQNEFLNDLKESLQDLKEGRIQKHKFINN